MDFDNFWFSNTCSIYDELREFFPDEFVKSFRFYFAHLYLDFPKMISLIDFAKSHSKNKLFSPGLDMSGIRTGLYTKELSLFIDWANSSEFKEVYDAYITKQNAITEKIAEKTETPTAEKKQTARQRRYEYIKNRDYKVKDMVAKFGNKCSLCGYEKPAMNEESELYSPSGYMYSFLQLHHILPIKDGGEDNIENLLCLCPNCHIKIHCGDTDKTREDLYQINRQILKLD